MKFKPNEQRAKWILTLFYIMLFLSPILIISSYMQYNLLARVIPIVQSQGFVDANDQALLEANDLRQQIVFVIYAVIAVLAIIFFIMWFRRAYYNIHQTGVKLDHSEGWAAGGWFVPFANLVIPYKIMCEIWTHTQEQAGKSNPEPTGIVLLWWVLFMGGRLIDRVLTKIYDGDEPSELLDSTLAIIAAQALAIPSLIVVILMIRKMMVFEKELYENGHEVDIADHLIGDHE